MIHIITLNRGKTQRLYTDICNNLIKTDPVIHRKYMGKDVKYAIRFLTQFGITKQECILEDGVERFKWKKEEKYKELWNLHIYHNKTS